MRAFNPFPGATASLGGQTLKIWAARPEGGQGAPGEIVAVGRDGIVVGCGMGCLRLLEVQKAGGKRLPVGDFLAGSALKPGQGFDPVPASA